jgi:chromosome partitioning protein
MKIITSIHQKGGVGKSTLTFNLANNLKKNAKICILDVDYQGSLYETKSLFDVDTYHISELDKVQKLDYDFAFVDTPPYLFEGAKELIQMSDIIIIPIKAGIFDTLSVQRTIDQLKEFGSENNALIVFNMVKHSTSLTEEIKDEVKELGVSVSENYISDLVAFTRSSVTNGVEENRTAQKQLDELTKEILTKSIIKA